MQAQTGPSISILACLFAMSLSINAHSAASDETCEIDYSALRVLEIREIESGLSIYRRSVKDGHSVDDLSEEEANAVRRLFEILDSRTRTVDRQDLIILSNADARLSDISDWDRADDRVCEPQDKTFSLYCALYFASIDTTGEY